MANWNSEYFIQLFLFGATIFCYVLLFVFISYAVYYCCIRTCLKVRRRRQQEIEQERKMENASPYCGHTQLINPFQNNKKATIVSISNTTTTSACPPRTEDTLNSNSPPAENNAAHFVDKKYYDIFMA